MEPVKVDTGRNPQTYHAPVARPNEVPGDVEVSMGKKIDQKLPEVSKAAAESTVPNPSTAQEGAKTISPTKSGLTEQKGDMPSKVPQALGTVSGHPNLGIDGKQPKDASVQQSEPHEKTAEIITAARTAQAIQGKDMDPAPKTGPAKIAAAAPAPQYDELEGPSKRGQKDQVEAPEKAPGQSEGRQI